MPRCSGSRAFEASGPETALSRYDVLYSGELTGEGRSAMFRAVRDEINSFSLSAKHQEFNDGWMVSVALRSGPRSVQVIVEDLDSPREAGAAASLIVDFINAHLGADHRIPIEPE